MTVREDLEKLLDEKADKTLASTSEDGLESQEHYVKLDGVETEATYDVVDSTLANTANLVQNKVITSKLNSFDPVLRDLDTRITGAAGNLIKDVKNALTTFANSYETLYNINVDKQTPFSPLFTKAKVCFPETGCKNFSEGGRGSWQDLWDEWLVYIYKGWSVSGNAIGLTYRNDALQTIQSIRERTVTVDNLQEQLKWVKKNVGDIFYKVDFMSWLVGAGGYGRPSGTQERDMLNAWKAMKEQCQKWLGKDYKESCWDQKWVK